MVKVYYQRQVEHVSLSDLSTVNRDALISRITQQDPSTFGIAYCGKLVDGSIQETLNDNDCLRIVPLKKKAELSASDKARIEEILKKMSRFSAYNGPVVIGTYHNETIAHDHVKKFVQQYPSVRDDPLALTALTDFYIFAAYLRYQSDDQVRQFLLKHPQFLVVCDKLLDHIQNSVYSGAMPDGYHQGYNNVRQQVPQQQIRNPVQAPAITQYDLQSALAMALGQGQAPQQQQQHQQPQQIASVLQNAFANQGNNQQDQGPDYTEQLVQLRDFGFQDEGLCLLALRQANGDVQLALELIVDMMQ